jgi:hypothetical protein
MMAGSEPGRRLVTGMTLELLVAGNDLLAAIDDPLRRDGAVERLITVAENGIAGLASFSVQRFQSFEAAEAAHERADASEDVLATALGELTIAQTLLSAAAATGLREGAAEPVSDVTATSPETGGLHASLFAVGAVPAALEADAGELAAAAGSGGTQHPSLTDAIDDLRKQVNETLDTVVNGSAEAAGKAVTGLLDLAPATVKQTIETLGERVKLGKIVNRLFRAALWALDQGLAALARLIPIRLLQNARSGVTNLYERLREEQALDVILAAILGVPDVREYTSQALSRPGLAPSRLEACATELVALTTRYKGVLRILQGIAVAVSLIAGTLAIVHIVVPQLALIVAGAQALVVAAVVVVGIDYIDVQPGPDLIRGVHTMLNAAME